MTHIGKQACGEAAGRVAARIMRGQPGDWGMDIESWDWNPGVGIIALMDYYERSERQDVLDFTIRWEARNRSQADSRKVINGMAPYAVYPMLYELTGDAYYREHALRIGEWMLTEAPRTRNGAFEHTVTESEQFAEQAWADTVFMAVLFLARLARVSGERKYAAEALHQLQLHFRLLQDAGTGVLFHGWDCTRNDPMSGARWGRANAWVALATPMIVQELEGIMAVPEAIAERQIRLLHGLNAYQAENGLWPVVVDRPDYRHELSGSAGIAAGFRKTAKLGWVGDSYRAAADLTLARVLEAVEEDGSVGGVSGGTPVLPSEEDYNAFEVRPTLYGQGLALMLFNEYL
ncbi:glycoside hydrolase family 88 protein [Paenibacillus thailandensis]|uniref:Glycoside hydrolase family 88 protein n=1 Tax=Paenibacillus thailandensis TaxID=393250 RepID=A0ABW5R0J2_9BACL